MAFNLRAITTAAMIAGLALAPAAQARDWHHGGGWHGRGGYGGYHRGGGGAGVAIGAGILGLAVGAAIGSSQQPYYAPPSYYAPPPAVYYGY
jgi:hypothetical protein